MSKKAWIVVIGLVLVLGGFFFLKNNQTTNVSTGNEQMMEENMEVGGDQMMEEGTSTEEGVVNEGVTIGGPTEVAIAYSDGGFSPKTMTIQKGTVVVFTNVGGRDMWIMSGVDADNMTLPAFNQKKVGTSYSFAFNEVGTYEYHNEAYPTHTGTIIVK